MRIVIETDEGKEPSVQAEPSAGAEAAAAPPPEVAARAAAEGALSAGPAPELPRDEGPIAFLPEPGTPSTAPQLAPGAPEDASAGSAPDFALGALAVDEREAEEEPEESEESEE
ncbi:MAG: hypothetical protein ACRDJT_11080 [Actinomycetota bacterium]